MRLPPVVELLGGMFTSTIGATVVTVALLSPTTGATVPFDSVVASVVAVAVAVVDTPVGSTVELLITGSVVNGDPVAITDVLLIGAIVATGSVVNGDPVVISDVLLVGAPVKGATVLGKSVAAAIVATGSVANGDPAVISDVLLIGASVKGATVPGKSVAALAAIGKTVPGATVLLGKGRGVLFIVSLGKEGSDTVLTEAVAGGVVAVPVAVFGKVVPGADVDGTSVPLGGVSDVDTNSVVVGAAVERVAVVGLEVEDIGGGNVVEAGLEALSNRLPVEGLSVTFCTLIFAAQRLFLSSLRCRRRLLRRISQSLLPVGWLLPFDSLGDTWRKTSWFGSSSCCIASSMVFSFNSVSLITTTTSSLGLRSLHLSSYWPRLRGLSYRRRDSPLLLLIPLLPLLILRCLYLVGFLKVATMPPVLLLPIW